MAGVGPLIGRMLGASRRRSHRPAISRKKSEVSSMNAISREEVYRDIREHFGLVPSFLQLLPDATLQLEWELMKRIELEPSAIPEKYRELIGLGIAAATKCRYCVLYHTEVAKLHGATDEEIEDAVHFAKDSAGWSTYLHGLQVDFEQFRDELRQAIEYVRSQQAEVEVSPSI